MSNASRSIRSILAVAALSTGVSWLAAGPAAATSCERDGLTLLRAPSTVASLCDEATDVRASGTYARESARADSELMLSAERLAQQAGLPGLSRATAVLSVADMGGIAAAAGLPSLPSGLPSASGLPEVSRLALLPDLPGLPGLPTAPGEVPQLSPVTGLLPVPGLPDASGVRDLRAPLELPDPVGEVREPVETVLPVVPGELTERVESAVPRELTEKKATDGIETLLKGLKLG